MCIIMSKKGEERESERQRPIDPTVSLHTQNQASGIEITTLCFFLRFHIPRCTELRMWNIYNESRASRSRKNVRVRVETGSRDGVCALREWTQLL